MCLNTVQEIQLFRRRLVIPRELDRLRDPSLQHLQVREDQLQVYRLYIAERIDTSIHMDDIRILKAAYHMYNGIHLADVGKELIPESLSF